VTDAQRLLTQLALGAAGIWLVLLVWLEARGLTYGRRRRFLLALPVLALLATIAVLVYSCG
jgi:hypothetical protein